ncbi:ribbon-helix-helix protein, CopG family [Rhodobacter sp. CZR27]|uniref:ribbon-helix-helix protein, CopG family n=1 Tax=Rhodobacter sp. CZR27 TaxID=2033869 RepID=UPI000BBE6F53|nr:ribbon-helix-helix protein, CopG family [Rhodobacter sp. CZR27]
MAKIGRPRAEGENIMLRLPLDMAAALDEVRKQESDLPTRQELIRRIVARYLEERGVLSGD